MITICFYSQLHFPTPRRVNHPIKLHKTYPLTFEYEESLQLLLFGKKYKLTRHKFFTFFFPLHAHNTNQQLYPVFTQTKKKYQPTPTYIFTYAKKEYQLNTFLHTQRNHTNKSQLTTIKPHQTYPSHLSMKNHFFLVRHKYKLTRHKNFAFVFLYMHTTQHQPTTIYIFTYAKKTIPTKPQLHFLHTQKKQYQPIPTYIFRYAKKQYQPNPTYIFCLHKETTPTDNYIRFYICNEIIPTDPYLHFQIRKEIIPTDPYSLTFLDTQRKKCQQESTNTQIPQNLTLTFLAPRINHSSCLVTNT